MVVQFHEGRYHHALNMGPGGGEHGDLYLLPFEEGEVYVTFTESSRGKCTRNTWSMEVPCSLEGKRLPVLWGSTVGSRKGLHVAWEKQHKGIFSGVRTYILEKVSSRIVRIREPRENPSLPEAEAWVRKYVRSVHKHVIFAFDPDRQMGKNERAPEYHFFSGGPRDDEKPYRDGEFKAAAHRIDVEPGTSSELDKVHGQDRLIELFRKARIPMMQYQGCISDQFEILSTNLDGWRNFKGNNWFTWKGFGSYVLINFHGAPVALVSIHQAHRHENPDWTSEMGEIFKRIEEIRKVQRAKENAVHQKGLDTHPVSYRLENHNGMVVCFAIMHDSSERVATIRKIEQDWRTKEIKIELGNFYHTIYHLSPFEYPWIVDHGLKGFFAQQTDLESEAERVAEIRKKYWAERVKQVFAQYEQLPAEKGKLPKLGLVAYYVEPDPELGGKPVRCQITDSDAFLPGMGRGFVKLVYKEKTYHAQKPRE